MLTLVPGEVAIDQLHAYVDHVLDEAGRARIEAQLQRRPLDRIKVASYRALNMKLRQLFDEPPPAVPAGLRELANRLIERLAHDGGAPLLRRC